MDIVLRSIDIRKFYYNSLYYDYIFNFDKVSKYYQYDYQIIDSYKKKIEDININYNHDLRPKICNILKTYNKKLGCSSKTIENINYLKDNDSVVVIGGQQPGLLTGPIFTIYKILTVLKVSSFLQNKFKIKVVPCFWNASDDSNLQYISSLNILNQGLQKVTLDLSGIKEGSRYSNIYLPVSRFEEVIIDLENALRPTDFKRRVIDFLNNCLKVASNFNGSDPNKINISTFFSVIISRMFSSYGLVVVDPAISGFKGLAHKILKYDIDNYPKISNIINSKGAELENDGYHAQLSSQVRALNFFWDIDGIREKVIADSRGFFKVANNRIEKNKLYNYIECNIEKTSLNVSLRPLFQDSVLPVVCCICGPGEVSYFAQLKEVYNLMNMKLPIIYPRFSATIVEEKVKKALNKLEITSQDLEFDREKLVQRKIKDMMDLDLDKLLKGLETDINSNIEGVEKYISGFEMNIYSTFDRIKRNVKKEIEVLRKKLYSDYKRQNNYIIQSVNKVFFNLFPNDNLQERELSIWGYINKYSFDLLDSLYLNLKPLHFSHKFLEIDS